MIDHPVGVHVVEVILQVRQIECAHAQGVDQHIFSSLDVEEPHIDPEPDEPVRPFNLVRAHIFCQKQFTAVLEIECFAGRVQFRQSIQKVGVQVGPFQSRKGRCQHIGGDHLIPALPEDSVPVLLAVPHLAHQKRVKAFALELVAFHHHQLHRAFAILKFRDMVQGGKARHFLIVTETLHSADVFFHNGGHAFLVRHGYWLFEQHLNEVRSPGLGAFFVVQVLLEHLIAHLLSSFFSGNSFHRNSSSFWTNSFGRPRGLAMRYQARKVRFFGSVSCW